MLFLGIFLPGMAAYAHNVGQSQTSKFFTPGTVKMLQDRAAGVLPGGPGIRTGDILSYIIESVPSPNGATLGSAGYVTDYIPPGMEVVGASFVDKVPDPTKVGGFAYIDRPVNLPGILGDGCGQRGCAGAYLPPFAEGSIARGTQDTGIFFSTDLRTKRLPQALAALIPPLAAPATAQIDITACSKSRLAGGQLAFLVFNQWDFDQTIAFGDSKGVCGGALVKAIIGGTGRGNPPVYAPNPLLPTSLVGLSSPVAGPNTYYTNDYNPIGDGVLATPSLLDFSLVGPWQRIYAPGSLIGGSGPVTSFLVNGPEVIAGVPTSAGWALSTSNPLPPSTNAVRWAIGERAVGTVEHVKIIMRVKNITQFGTGAINNLAYTNHSEVYGGDASGGAQGGKDMVFAYIGPSQANNNAQLMVTKKVVAVAPTAIGPWTSSTGAFIAPGQFVKYRLNYLNAASAPLYNLIISDELDALETIATGPSLPYDTGNPFLGVPVFTAAAGALPGKLTWPTILSLAPGGGGSMDVIIQVTGAGGGAVTANTISATASNIAPPALPNLISSKATVVSTLSGVGATPSITQSKTVTPSATTVGGTVLYSITLNNAGGAVSQPVKGNANIAKGPIYPASAGLPSLIVGDKMPEYTPLLGVPTKALTYLNTQNVSVTDSNTGIAYPLLPAQYTVDIATRPGDVFWEILTYPALFPVVGGLPFDFAYGSLQIDFYATVAPLTPAGVYTNQAESYVGTWDTLKGKQGKDVNKITPNQAPVSISSPDFTGFWKTATDINGTPTAPGEVIQYNLNATNVGLAAATNVVVFDSIPANSSFVVGSAVAAGAPVGVIDYYSSLTGLPGYIPVGLAGSVDPYVSAVRYTYASVAVGATATPSFRVQASSTLGNGAVLSNQARLTSFQTGLTTFLSDDPSQPGAADPTITTITAQPDYTSSSKSVAVNGVASSSFVSGDSIAYTITVKDTGNNGAGSSNISVVDTIDVGVLDVYSVVLSAPPLGWTVVGPDLTTGRIVWNAISFAQAASAVFTVTATAKAALPQGTTLDNNISITSNEIATPTVIPAPQISIPQTKVSGIVFGDSNGNGVQDVGEIGVANVTVALQATGSGVDASSTITNASGQYTLVAATAGTWDVRVTDATNILNGFNLTTAANPLPVTLISGQTLNNQHFGYQLANQPAVVKGRIFNDANGDGIENVAETGLSAVSVELRTATDVLLASAVTDVYGDYIFPNIANGDYRLVITDTGSVLNNFYLTTGLSSPVTLNGLLSGSISTVNFGYRLGSIIGDFIFNDLASDGYTAGVDTGLPNIVLTLNQGGIPVYSTVTDNSGAYTFTGVAEGAYQLVVTPPVGFTLTTPLVPTAVTAVSGINQLSFDFGYNALPVLSVTKTVASPIVGYNQSVEYTMTIQNTGGAAANFRIKDVLPSTTPPVVLIPPTYTPSAGSFQYLSTSNVLLNGQPFNIPTNPINFSTQPVWSGFTMPANSTMKITFTAFSDAIDGMYYNGVQLLYNNGIQSTLNFPDLAQVTVSTAGTLNKAVTAVNGVPWTTGTPVVAQGDTVTYTVTLSNSAAAVPQAVSQFTETMPVGFTYVAASTLVTAPVNPLAVPPVPTVLGQNLTWLMPVPKPSTLAGNALSNITMSFDLLVGPSALIGTNTDIATADVYANLSTTALNISTGNVAPVNVVKPILAMVKNTSTPLISKDVYGNYTPASYSITVNNSGSAIATGVVITDVLPVGFTINATTVAINGSVLAPAAISVGQVGRIVTINSNTAGGFSIPANNGTSDGILNITYDATIAPATAAGNHLNSASLVASNAAALTGASANVELTDIQLSKVSSTPIANKGGVATYTITVANNGATVMSNILVSDLLPTDLLGNQFSYQIGSTLINGVAAADPLGTANTPQWTLANIAANSVATIQFSADISANMTATTYFNTIQASNGGATSFPNPGPTAPVIVQDAQPSLSFSKTVTVISDPVNLTNNPLSIPGAELLYRLQVNNSGTGTVDADTIVMIDPINTNIALVVTDINGAGSGPVGFTDNPNGTGASGLTYTFTALNDALDDVSFSNDNGATYTYTPTPDANGVDTTVTHIKIAPKGIMAANTGAGNTNFELRFKVKVK